MTAAQSLFASAEAAERAGKAHLADFWRGMARDALSFEGAGIPGLYDHWSREVADYAAKFEVRQ